MIDVRLLLEKKCKMSLPEQCALLDINRSSVYYKSKGENSDNLKAMTLMDLHILDEPTAGVITMQNMLEEHGLRMSSRNFVQVPRNFRSEFLRVFVVQTFFCFKIFVKENSARNWHFFPI